MQRRSVSFTQQAKQTLVSTIQRTYKELADDYGFEIVDTGINTMADVDMAANDLASKVDCISNLTDNTVVSALQTVLAAANDSEASRYLVLK